MEEWEANIRRAADELIETMKNNALMVEQATAHIAALEAKLKVWEEAYQRCENIMGYDVYSKALASDVWHVIREAHEKTKEQK